MTWRCFNVLPMLFRLVCVNPHVVQTWAMAVRTGRSKGDKLGVVDHSTVEYLEFRRDFYVEGPELARMTKEEVEALRKELDDIKVRVCRGMCVEGMCKGMCVRD